MPSRSEFEMQAARLRKLRDQYEHHFRMRRAKERERRELRAAEREAEHFLNTAPWDAPDSIAERLDRDA